MTVWKSVDFHLLNERLKQNSLQEKLSARWLAHCTRQLGAQRARV